MRLFASFTLFCLAWNATQGCQIRLEANPGGFLAPEVSALELDESIETILNDFRMTPGLAVGITRGNNVLYSRGFGYRELETCGPVTDQSVFYLLSVTKSFTGMLAALLQEEGVIELDQSLQHYYPELTMLAPINPAQTSIRDLLLHRAGFFSGGINYRTYIPANIDNDGIIYLLENHARPAPITFRYSNMSYIIAAMVMEKVTGESWRHLLETRIFQPLGMNSTTASIEHARAGEFAYPYTIDRQGVFVPTPVKVEEQMHAAGGTASSVHDLLQWVQLNLNNGKVDGEQVIPARVVRQAQAPQIQYDWEYYKFRRFAYGLGVHNADYEGDLLIHHFGGPIHVSFMPERDLGIVVLTSGPRSARMSHMIAAFLYDRILTKPNLDEKWADEIEAVWQASLDSIAEFYSREDELLAQRSDEQMSRPLNSYVGGYVSDRLGTMTVAFDDGSLMLTFGVQEKELIPFQPDTFLIYLDPDGLPAVFHFRENPGTGNFTLDWGERLFAAKPPSDTL